ncbi:MAG TPA: hypothetical protein VKV15_27595 [Bryobacteraceae bacterium]|nr:hypothetical protein [Bryobacteraceae bacterium]
MDRPATYEDVNLLLRLYELRREEKLRVAREWFVKNFHFATIDEFLKGCPPGSERNTYARMVISYWEMVCSFVMSGVLHAELLFQSNQELLLVWERVRELTPAMRTAQKNPTVWKNLEAVGNQFIAYMNHTAPGSYEAFAERIRTL